MTSVLEREVRPSDSKRTERAARRLARGPSVPFDLSPAGRILLAVLSASAGVVHLAMVPSHIAESTTEGIGFALTGWIQIALAVLLLTRPSRTLLRVVMLFTLGTIAIWVVSRTAGLPFGDHSWQPHDPAFIDLATVGIEVALLVAAGVLLFRPGLARGWDRRKLAFGAVVPLAILGLTSAALASPSARDHASGSHAAHDSAGGAAGASTDGHDHGSTAALGSGSNEADLDGLAMLENGHQHGSGVVELDDATQAALATQLAETNTLVAKYPNIAAAEAAGYRRSGPFSPGLGTHYTGFGAGDSMQGVDGPMRPTLIFDGLEPTSPLAGFMYMGGGQAGAEPEGFIGPNDHWHYHTNTCVVFKDGVIEAPLGADRPVEKSQCDAYGGSFIENTGYMVHVWTVPGYESSLGTFSNINPALTCPDGTYRVVQVEEIGFRKSTCKNPS